MRAAIKFFISILFLLSSLGLVSLSISSPLLSTWYVVSAVVATTSLALIRPNLSILLFLFFLPVFGNKPGTAQVNYLLIFAMALQIGLTVGFWAKLDDRKEPQPLSAGFWYLLISVLSLFPISFGVFWLWFRASQTSFTDLNLLSWNLSSILVSREDNPAYPLLSVFWTGLSFSLAYFIYLSGSLSKQTAFKYCWALFGGFLLSMFVGLCNYYGLVNLACIRELDPVVNPGNRQYRLQSWFGHSGWFAEYVTMLAPFVMLTLTLKIPYWLRVSIVLFLLLVGEIVLILTFQRGGWLSYPVTLLAVWASIYALRRLEKGDQNIFDAIKKSTLKILISLPLTLLVSFLLLKSFGSQFGMDQYAERFKDITKASDRSEFIKAGFQLGALNPILGLGSESFALQYRREYREPDGVYSGQIDLPLHGSAHNFYAQTFAGKGVLGLLSLLAIMFFTARSALLFVFAPESNQERRQQVIALICFCSILACFIYGFVQELFYVQTLQFIFFAVLGILICVTRQERKEVMKKRSDFLIAGSLLLLFFAHISWSQLKSRSYSDTGGCYLEESNQQGQSWRWCGVRASIEVPAEQLANRTFSIETAPARDMAKNFPQLLRVEACNQNVFAGEVRGAERVNFSADLDQSQCSDARPGFIKFKTYYGGFFIPAQENENEADRRVLALRWIY